MLFEKPLESITEADLQSLLDNGVAEGKTIDYKESLPGNNHASKKEFLADVSSFANAAGGYLIFGIRAEKGVPVTICGLADIDPDAEIQRLDNLTRDGIDPRIPGVTMKAVRLGASGVVIVAHVPRSWAQPHVVDYDGHWRFYSRCSVGKYQLDVSELRSAFAVSGTLAERVKLFRTERLGKIVAGETPVPLSKKAKTVFHIVPFGAFDPGIAFDISAPDDVIVSKLKPVYGSVASRRYNLDGLVAYYPYEFPASSYVQLFRNGIVEAVDDSAGKIDAKGKRWIQSVSFEKRLWSALPDYFSVQKQLGVTPPFFIMLTMLEVSGYAMEVALSEDHICLIDRDTLLLPDIVVQGFEVDAAKVMRPIFDSVWNATGWPRSMNYDDSGEWGKGRNFLPMPW